MNSTRRRTLDKKAQKGGGFPRPSLEGGARVTCPSPPPSRRGHPGWGRCRAARRPGRRWLRAAQKQGPEQPDRMGDVDPEPTPHRATAEDRRRGRRGHARVRGGGPGRGRVCPPTPGTGGRRGLTAAVSRLGCLFLGRGGDSRTRRGSLIRKSLTVDASCARERRFAPARFEAPPCRAFRQPPPARRLPRHRWELKGASH